MITGRHVLILATLALLFLVSLPSAYAQDAEPQAAVGSAGASDQVENWIRENLAGMREEADQSAAKPVAGEPASAMPAGEPQQASPGHVPGAEVVAPPKAGGYVNWAEGTISFTAEEFVSSDSISPARERAIAVRRATLLARKALLDAVLGLPLDGRRTVGTALDDAELAALRSALQNSRVDQHETMEEGGGLRLSVTAFARFRGDFAELLLPGGDPFLGGVPETIGLTVSQVPAPQPDAEQAAYRASMAELGGFTGLVVDARGLGTAPALLPVVADPSGLTAYGPFQVSREDVAGYGAAVYATHPAAAMVASRVGKTPLVVRALAVSGANKADLVVSYADAALIRTLFKAGDMKNNCKAAVILD